MTRLSAYPRYFSFRSMIESNMAGALRATVLPKRFLEWILPFFRLTVISLARAVHDVTAVSSTLMSVL